MYNLLLSGSKCCFSVYTYFKDWRINKILCFGVNFFRIIVSSYYCDLALYFSMKAFVGNMYLSALSCNVCHLPV
jgi:hypothetical protein